MVLILPEEEIEEWFDGLTFNEAQEIISWNRLNFYASYYNLSIKQVSEEIDLWWPEPKIHYTLENINRIILPFDDDDWMNKNIVLNKEELKDGGRRQFLFKNIAIAIYLTNKQISDIKNIAYILTKKCHDLKYKEVYNSLYGWFIWAKRRQNVHYSDGEVLKYLK